MTRPPIYVGLVIGVCAVAAGLVLVLRPSPVTLLLVAAACLVPGRLQGVLWRDFFRGRHALSTGDPAEALACFERFRATLDARPWLSSAIYLAGSAYTWNARAMLANDIGAARLLLGQVDAAEAAIREAVERDPGYSLAVFNLGLVAHLRGDEAAAESLRERAVRLGYTGGTRDRLVHLAASALAAAEGGSFRRGRRPAPSG